MEPTFIRLCKKSDGVYRVKGATWECPVTTEEVEYAKTKARALIDVYEHHRQGPLVDRKKAVALGQQLRDTFLAPLYDGTDGSMTQHYGALVFSSDQPDLLNLPWELLPNSNGNFITADPRWSIRRTTLDPLPKSETVRVPTQPLRILFYSCAPVKQAALDYDKEEDEMFEIAHRLPESAHLVIDADGTFENLKNRISHFRPHVVHLCGHSILRDSIGRFAFEAENGDPDWRDSQDIAMSLFAISDVCLVFVSGCCSAQAGVAGICQQLTKCGVVPLALGWGAKIDDDHAREFARDFYNRLSTGSSICEAVSQARLKLFDHHKSADAGTDKLDASFVFPQLYVGSDIDQIIDEALIVKLPMRCRVVRKYLGHGISGLTKGFVGRRQELQRAGRLLRGPTKQILLLTGVGGSGKSTLATRLANQLESDGFTVAAVRASENQQTPFLIAVFEAISRACNEPKLEEKSQLRNGRRTWEDRIRIAVELLNLSKTLLVLDNLEVLLAEPPSPPKWLDQNNKLFVSVLQKQLTGEGRAILTSRVAPKGFQMEAESLLHEPVKDFDFDSFRKYLKRDSRIAIRIEREELSTQFLEDFHNKLGGTPEFLQQTLAILATSPVDMLQCQLKAIGKPDRRLAHAELLKLQQEHFRKCFLPQLYNGLDTRYRTALSRFAVTEIPLPVRGFVAIAGISPEEAGIALEACVSLALIQRFEEGHHTLYTVYPLQRRYLVNEDRLKSTDRMDAHRAAAGYLMSAIDDSNLPYPPFSTDEGLRACLYHAELGEDPDSQRWATLELTEWLYERAEFKKAERLIGNIKPSLDGFDSKSYGLLAKILESQCKWKRARKLFKDILEESHARGKWEGEARAFIDIAGIHIKQSKFSKARDNLEKSMEIYKQNFDTLGEANALHKLGCVEFQEGNYGTARESFERALETWIEKKDLVMEPKSRCQMAKIDIRECNFQSAHEHLNIALDIRKELPGRNGEKLPDRNGIAAVQHITGDALRAEGDRYRAREKYQTALKTWVDIDDLAGIVLARLGLAHVDIAEGHLDDACENLKLAWDNRTDDYRAVLETLGTIGQLAWKCGMHDHAFMLVEAAYRQLKNIKSGDADDLWEPELAELAKAMQLNSEAKSSLEQLAMENYKANNCSALVQSVFDAFRDD